MVGVTTAGVVPVVVDGEVEDISRLLKAGLLAVYALLNWADDDLCGNRY